MTTIRHWLLSLLVFVHWIQGHVDGSDVYQTPKLWEKQGENATIHCNHTKGGSYFQMYWYRQLPGETMKLIVFSTTVKHDFGEFSQDKFSATKTEAERGTFTVKNLQPADTGWYFCAGDLKAPITHTDSDCGLKVQSSHNTIMITAALIKLSAALLCIGGLTDGRDVTQTLLLWKNEGQSATMNCSHTKDASYFQMYWYQQLPGEGMRQIVFTSTSPPHKYESGFSEDKFPAEKKDAQTGSLTVKKLQPQDSGVYFCAVSQHSDAGDLKSCTKTQLLVSQ
ncbi:uncharacterized protein [Leuresthes tenuis]|uniref:uncharacterized protein n=1 Tax=Leuresthes tenuis TaxID=355514 RepID=UPI003B502F28